MTGDGTDDTLSPLTVGSNGRTDDGEVESEGSGVVDNGWPDVEIGLDERDDWTGATGADGALGVTSVGISSRDGDAGGQDCRYMMRESADCVEVESVSGRLIGAGSINTERASLGETPLDDKPTESIRSDNI